jgi:hypothetical protein
MVPGFTVELEGDLIERKGYELREEVRTWDASCRLR